MIGWSVDWLIDYCTYSKPNPPLTNLLIPLDRGQTRNNRGVPEKTGAAGHDDGSPSTTTRNRRAGRNRDETDDAPKRKEWNDSTRVDNLPPDELLRKHPGWDTPYISRGGRIMGGMGQGGGMVREAGGFFAGGSSARTITTRTESGGDVESFR